MQYLSQEVFWLCRRFPTVERRAVLHQKGTSLSPIPGDEEFCDGILKELGLKRKLGSPALDEVSGLDVARLLNKFWLLP